MAAHHAARVAGGTVGGFEFDRPSTSYFYAVLNVPERSIAALCNRAYPIVAFSDEPDNLYLTRRFVEESVLASAFEESSFQVAPYQILISAPSAASLDALGGPERENVQYWIRHGDLSQTGDLIYNDWD